MRILSVALLFIGVSASFADAKVTINSISPNMNANSCATYSDFYTAYLISLDSVEKIKQKLSKLPADSEDRTKWENLLPPLEAQTEALQEEFKESKELEIFTAQVTLSQSLAISKDKLSDSGGAILIRPIKSESDEEIGVEGTVQVIAYGPKGCGNVEEAGDDINKAIRQNILDIFSIE